MSKELSTHLSVEPGHDARHLFLICHLTICNSLKVGGAPKNFFMRTSVSQVLLQKLGCLFVDLQVPSFYVRAAFYGRPSVNTKVPVRVLPDLTNLVWSNDLQLLLYVFAVTIEQFLHPLLGYGRLSFAIIEVVVAVITLLRV